MPEAVKVRDMRLRAIEAPDETISQSGRTRTSSRHTATGTEAIHVRNYDHDRGYEVDVEVETEDGEVPFQRRYQLQPGQIVSEYDVLSEGNCVVMVTLDDTRERALECRIGESPEHTATIEVGNGALSLVEGLNGGRRRSNRSNDATKNPREHSLPSTEPI